MRIVVHGQQAFGKAVLDALVERGEDVVAVYAAPDKPGQRADPMVEAAGGHGLTIHRPSSFRGEEVADAFRSLRPDLQVMAFVTLLVPATFLRIPTHGSIQYHPSLLPRGRGPSAINWPIIKGETETGLTIFWPDDGLDTGDVLLQRAVPIGPDDSLGSLYFDRLFPMGVEAMVEAVDLVRAGRAPRIAQVAADATYEGWCTTDNARIDWGRPWRQIHDLVRGCDPSPGAWTTFDGETVQVFGAQPTAAREPAGIGGRMGEIVGTDPDGFSVVCADGRIRVHRVRGSDGQKIDAGTWASQVGLRNGARLT